MREVKVGTIIINSRGEQEKVLGVYPQGRKKVYRVIMSDGTETESCDDHLWEVREDYKEQYKVLSLSEIRKNLTGIRGGNKYSTRTVGPVKFASKGELLVDPYLLGLYLGDGSSSGNVMFSNPEPDIQEKFLGLLSKNDVMVDTNGLDFRIKRRTRDNGISDLKKCLQDLGLCGMNSYTKFIPEKYLFSSRVNRLKLLRGLIDTDGTVSKKYGLQIEYSTSSPRLAEDVTNLVRGLGGLVKLSSRIPAYSHKGKKLKGQKSYRLMINFSNGIVPVSSEKHLAKWNKSPKQRHKHIVQVTYSGKKECQCIRVASGLYVTDDYIVTHNTSLALDWAVIPTVERKLTIPVVTTEMSKDTLAKRIYSSWAGIPYYYFRPGFRDTENDKAYTRAMEGLEKFKHLSFAISDNLRTLSQIRRSLTKLVERGHNPNDPLPKVGYAVIDYLQLIELDGPDNNRQRTEVVSKISRGLKLLASELDIPIVVMSSLNRLGLTEGSSPDSINLRDSGTIGFDAEAIFFVHNPAYVPGQKYVPQEVTPIDLILSRQRNGPTGTIPLHFIGSFMQFMSQSQYDKYMNIGGSKSHEEKEDFDTLWQS